jgi:hypothetical protein
MLSADLSPTSVQPLDAPRGPVFGDEQVPFADAAARTQVPFKGSLEGLVTRSGAPPIIMVKISATGTATHLGQFAVSIPHAVNVVTRTAMGNYLFVAANGDTLNATFTGASMPTAADPTVLSIVENATISGGTGRFAGATGSFKTERLYDTIAGTTTGSFSGTISSPGAANSSATQASSAPLSLSSTSIGVQQPDSSPIFGSENVQQDQAVLSQVLE